MSDDPFADIVAAPRQQSDPFADIVQPRRRTTQGLPGGGMIPLFARDIGRSILSVPVDVARLTGHLTGSEGLSQWGEGANNWLNRNVSPEARFADDPVGAALQFGGSALVPMGWLAGPLAKTTTTAARAVLPAATVASPTAQAVGAGALRAAELALPGSAPFTAGNIAANAGVGIAAGAGIESLQDTAERDRYRRENPAPVTPATTNADPFADIVPQQSRTLAEVASDNLPWVIGGLSVLSVGAAARMAARAAADQAARASVGSFVQPGTPASAASMVGNVEGVVNGLANSNEALMNRADTAVRDGRMTRAQADDVIGTVITHANESVTSDVLREAWNTGVLPGGMRMPTPRDMTFEAAQLRGKNQAADPLNPSVMRDDFVRFNDLLAAADELDVRMDNVRAGKWMTSPTGGRIHGVAARSALHDVNDAQLRMRIAEARRNPEIAALEQKFRQINNTLLDYGERRGIWSAREVADMRAKGPNYLHRMVADMALQRDTRAGLNPITKGTERNSPLTERNRTENGGPQRFQDPIMSLEDGMRQTLDFIRRNEAIRNVARYMSEQPGRQNLSGIGRVLLDRPGTQHRPGYVPVPYRDDFGTRYILELDPTISQGLLPYPRAFVPIANIARMLEQKLTTGPIGFIMGNLQAPASAVMGTIAAAINAPKHLRLGYIDKIIYHYTGGKVNLRQLGIVDPTFAVQVIEAFGRDMASTISQSLSASLQRSVDSNGLLARQIDILGQGRAQSMADWFKDQYTNSYLHLARREGLQAQGLAYAAEGGGKTDFAARLENLTQMSPEYAARMNYAGFAPDISKIRSLDQFREYMAVTSARMGAMPGKITLARAWQNYSKMLDLVSNAPQSAIYRANRQPLGRNERGLIGTARSITGDPSQYGSYRLIQGIMSLIPFGNITMQANHQLYKAFKREPIGMPVRTAMVGTMLSVAMLQSAIFADETAIEEGREPGAVAHMLTRDSRDAAAAFRFYLPNGNPEASIRIGIEQSFAPLLSATLSSIIRGFDVDNPEFFSGRYAPLRDSVHRLVEDGDGSRFRAALGIAGGDIPMLGAVDAAARMLTGRSVENAMNLATGPRIDDVYDADGLSRSLVNNDVSDRYTATVLETAMGFSGQAFLDLWRTFGMASRDPQASPMRAVAQQYTLNMSGGARIIGPAMFGQERRMRTNDVVGEMVRATERKLDDITRNLGHIRGGEGSIGPSTRLREAPMGGGREALQPDMVPILGQLTRLNSSLAIAQKERSQMLETLRSYNSSPQLRGDPNRLRSETNKIAERVREINSMIYQRILSAEADLSEATGRRVRISDLDPMQGLDQFPPLSR